MSLAEYLGLIAAAFAIFALTQDDDDDFDFLLTITGLLCGAAIVDAVLDALI